MIRYYCSGYDVNNVFGHGLGDMLKSELKDTNTIVYVVGDPKRQKKVDKAINILVPSFRNSFEKVGISFNNEKIILPTTSAEDAKKWIDESSFVMLMGGDPFDQKEMCEELGIMDNIRNYQGVLMGYSAGAMMMSKNIIITPVSEEYPEFKIGDGLNFDNISIFPHNNTSLEEYPELLDLGEEKYKREDLIAVAKKYGNFYLLQDYLNENNEWDISIIKSVDGKLEFYTENNGKIWIATENGINLEVPKLTKNILK